MILCDTNIFVDLFRGKPEVAEALKHIGKGDISLSAVTYMELLVGARDKTEVGRIRRALDRLVGLPLDERISSLAMELIGAYSKSHGLYIPDALIAATSMIRDSELFTFNIKDFRFIEGLKLYCP